ncbi:hypothetical protein L596_003198 [Steinernema carpocapsae]|uniref:Uncharacterized protein n=1 Tax=Steinernema carpocapsae TaxID=34508 RepID=A0A4U8UVS8_STECR|nr:hypothetical protein L596_003198 [Steinernema carpocapsae]
MRECRIKLKTEIPAYPGKLRQRGVFERIAFLLKAQFAKEAHYVKQSLPQRVQTIRRRKKTLRSKNR